LKDAGASVQGVGNTESMAGPASVIIFA
jgi:hypothetical protein